MHFTKTPSFLFRLRSAVFGFAAAGLFYVCFPSPCVAVLSRGAPVYPYKVIDPAEGAKRMASFRSLRLEGDFCFKFQLEHKPRGGKTVRYHGVMYGSWNERGPVSRFQFFPEQMGKDAPSLLTPIEMIVQNGVDPEVWVRRQSAEAFVLIEGGALFEPVFDGVLFTPFDLQMPFVFWHDYVYEGPSRVLSRIGQRFLMQPPRRFACRSEWDYCWCALHWTMPIMPCWRVEVLEADAVARSRFTVSSLKKVQGQYIVKEIELKNLQSKDATDFKVKAASVGFDF